jgi:hypothetical protein
MVTITQTLDHIREFDCDSFMTLPGEKLIVAKRQHGFILITPIVLAVISTLFILGFQSVMFFFLNSIILLFLGALTGLLILINVLGKILVDWYFHLYIVTTRRILEVRLSPFASTISSQIMLDQVKCTEIDTQGEGFLNQLLDVGNICLTFDRPTQQQNFYLSNIKHYRKVGALLSDELRSSSQNQQNHTEPIWYRNPTDPATFIYSERNLNRNFMNSGSSQN